MPRYFIEVAYKGTMYSGFQVQDNANSIQADVEKSLRIFFKKNFELTGSSRTDAGVHALQNFFHFDVEVSLDFTNDFVYNLNALLPGDIVVKNVTPVNDDAHCRFDAVSREYKYFIYREKDPFLQDRAWYYPYSLDMDKLNKAAEEVMRYNDFSSFSKTNTQVKHFICDIKKSEWKVSGKTLVYNVEANRFLRGMVKALTGTMLRVGRGKISVKEFCEIIENKNCMAADFTPPSHGLFLEAVNFKPGILV